MYPTNRFNTAKRSRSCKIGKGRAEGGGYFFEVNTDNSAGGWYLADIRYSRYEPHYRAYLRGNSAHSESGVFEIHLPILRHGRSHEIVWLPDDISNLTFQLPEPEPLEIIFSKIVLLERVVRMANRVYDAFRRTSRLQRKAMGLSCWSALTDLSGVYQVVSLRRGALRYADWISRHDLLAKKDKPSNCQKISAHPNAPHFDLVIVSDARNPSLINQTLNSLGNQLYRKFSATVLEMSANDVTALILPDDINLVSNDQLTNWLVEFNESLARFHEGKWLMLVYAGDVLAAHALHRFACAALDRPSAVLLYSDDDALDANGQRCQPRFKPDWSMAHFRATNYIGDAAALRGSEVAKAGGLDMGWCRYGNRDLLFRVLDVTAAVDARTVVHIPEVLLHTMHQSPEGGAVSEWNKIALQTHLARNGVSGEVLETLPGCWRVRYSLPEVPPLVSIIVPTKNALQLIRQCVASLLEKTSYPRYEILVVDNQSTEPDVLDYLAQIARDEEVRLLHYNMPFNFSAINNWAVREARGEVVCLLNNDTEVISPDWLEEMVGHLLQLEVGVVGAKLFFPDGSVQHGGDLVGVGGVANHAHSFLQRDEPGYCNRAVVAQELSAVTAACLITWRHVYQELGGLDERHLPVAFNDVDYCLRVHEAGYKVVWTPHAELYHHESVSRGKDSSPAKKRRAEREVAYMRKRWRHVLNRDPFYNPNLSYERPDFSLSHTPMVGESWQR